MPSNNSRLVYSTEKNENYDPEPAARQQAAEGGTAYIERDRKNRKGKVVTVISGLKGNLKELQKEIQKICGAGGSIKNGKIEIQGDHREKIAKILQGKGYKVKFIGG